MKRLFKIAGIVSASTIVAFILFIYLYESKASLFEKHSHKDLASILTPHFQISKPPGDGPFPAVIRFPGGSGSAFLPNGDICLVDVNWADYFVSLGYACILVDSYTGRGYSTGSKFGVPERSGDVLAALTEVSKLPFVKPDQLVIMGHSHGGWAIMSLLAMDLNKKLPPNLSAYSAKSMVGVKGAIVLYPYCPGLDSGGNDWNNSIKTLVLMGGKDRLTKACLRTLSILKEKNKPVTFHVYPSAYHSYDESPEDFKKISEWFEDAKPPDLEATADSRERIKNFLSDVFSQP
jgi:dienelactone hydrolase